MSHIVHWFALFSLVYLFVAKDDSRWYRRLRRRNSRNSVANRQRRRWVSHVDVESGLGCEKIIVYERHWYKLDAHGNCWTHAQIEVGGVEKSKDHVRAQAKIVNINNMLSAGPSTSRLPVFRTYVKWDYVKLYLNIRLIDKPDLSNNNISMNCSSFSWIYFHPWITSYLIPWCLSRIVSSPHIILFRHWRETMQRSYNGWLHGLLSRYTTLMQYVLQ